MATPPEAGAATPAEAAPRAASDAAELARAVGTSMFAADHATRVFMQMELLGCEPGHARMRMTVRDELLNGHKICHGGFIFTLADSTFAYACNSHNKVTVAAGCSIEFLKPALPGDVLTCTGRGCVETPTTATVDHNFSKAGVAWPFFRCPSAR